MMSNNGTPSDMTSVDSHFLLLTRVRLVVKFYIWPLLVVFGLTGNCLSILVLTRRRLIRTSTNNYLTILAAFDSCYLVLTLILNFGSHPTFAQSSVTQTILFCLRPLADFSSNTATWLIVCFTLERTLAVTRPIYAKRTCSVRRSRHVIGTILILCFLITIPTFLEKYFMHHVTEGDRTNSTIITEGKTPTGQKSGFVIFHRLYLVFICVVIIWIPLTLICVCNSILIWYVHRSRRFGGDFISTAIYDSYHRSSTVSMNPSEYSPANYSKSSFSSSPTALLKNPYTCHLRRHNHSYLQKRKVTIVLIVCLCVALLLWTPQSLSLTYETMIESYAEMSSERRILLLIFNNFANLFLCINASIDFILYYFLSENFARTCKQIVFRQCSNYNTKFSQRSRFISFDRTSFVIHTPSNNHHQHQHQQQSAANSTNYYAQLYGSRRNPSIIKLDAPNRTWKKRILQTPRARTTLAHSRSHRRVLYQKSLLEYSGNGSQRPQNEYQTYPNDLGKSIEITSNVDEDCTQNELNGSSHTLVSSRRPSRSGAVSNA